MSALAMDSQTERRLQVKSDQRESVNAKLQEIFNELDGGEPSELQRNQMADYRSDIKRLDEEIDALAEDVERDREAKKKSDDIRRASMASRGVADITEGGEVIYRSLGQIAIDTLLTHKSTYARSAVSTSGVSSEEIQRAEHRLEAFNRIPATTLTSDVAGLTAPQHLAQIFQIINSRRDLVDAAGVKVNLNRLNVTYPQVDGTPVVAAQGTEKTEAGNVGLDVSLVTAQATTYLGGGNLSWQAIEFSDPSTYDLWFREIAADYALKTEQDAGQVVTDSAFTNTISGGLSDITDYAEVMTAVAAGGAEVYANSGRMANAVIMSPDAYWSAIGITSATSLALGESALLNIAGEQRRLRVIVSRGLDAGVIIVGDMEGLLVAENAGAPVRMFVSEPAIAGVEVGLVGAFEAAVVDDGAFALITAAS